MFEKYTLHHRISPKCNINNCGVIIIGAYSEKSGFSITSVPTKKGPIPKAYGIDPGYRK